MGQGPIFITDHCPGVAQGFSAPAWGAGGRGFNSRRPDHLKSSPLGGLFFDLGIKRANATDQGVFASLSGN